METQEFKIIRDKYKSARGGYSRILNVYCRSCGDVVLVYQKDGPGSLKRLYLDRIYSPQSLVGMQNLEIKNIGRLKCMKCGETLGVSYVYKKENRKAFRLFQDAVYKRIRKKGE